MVSEVQQENQEIAITRVVRGPRERRARARYPVERLLHFLTRKGKSLSVSGGGTSINISSIGMLLETTNRLTRGERVIAAIDWPCAPEGQPAFLLVEGSVVWVKGSHAGLSLSHYRFVPAWPPGEDPANVQLDFPKHLTPTRSGGFRLAGFRWNRAAEG